MKILYYKKDKDPEVLLIPREVKDMQELVHGRYEVYQVNEKILIVCNDDGWNLGLEVNRLVLGKEGNIEQAIRGDFFVCGAGEEDFISLTDLQIKKLIRYSYGNKFPGWIH